MNIMKNKDLWVLIIIILLLVLFAGMFSMRDDFSMQNNKMVGVSNTMMQNQMQIKSNIFANNGNIPVQYTCDGAGTQVPLEIFGVPASAKSLALIVDDPDAPMGLFVHWVVWNIDPKTFIIENAKVPAGAVEGFTGLNKPGFVAPCPPTGIHHYHFKLYALDTLLSIPNSTNEAGLVSAMNDHIIKDASLVGLYGKGM
jgi:Raf kinase inhibitor-like YbhB/YbcL family protein